MTWKDSPLSIFWSSLWQQHLVPRLPQWEVTRTVSQQRGHSRSVSGHGVHIDPGHVHPQVTGTGPIKLIGSLFLCIVSVSVKCLNLVVNSRAKVRLTYYAKEKHRLEEKGSSQNLGWTTRPQKGQTEQSGDWVSWRDTITMYLPHTARDPHFLERDSLTQRGPKPSGKWIDSTGNLTTVTKEADQKRQWCPLKGQEPAFLLSLWSHSHILQIRSAGTRGTLFSVVIPTERREGPWAWHARSK